MDTGRFTADEMARMRRTGTPMFFSRLYARLGRAVWCGAVMLVLSPLAGVGAAEAAKRVALVIGNNDYRNVPPLQKAVNDARTMGDALKQIGFQVFTAENQSRRALSETLLSFDQAIEKDDVVFFFFAGHGFEINGQNYLLPTDIPAATEGQEELVRDSAVAAERIVSRMQARGARTAIFVFDACRNNPFERKGTRAVSGSGGLAAMTPPEGVFIIFSAGAKQSALDRLSDNDTNPNSVFTRAFVQQLERPGASLVQVAKQTQADVRKMASGIRHTQTPAYYDQIVGDVVLHGTPDQGQRTIVVEPQVAALAPVARAPDIDTSNAPIASFSRHNGGWTVSFSIAEPVLGISWRFGESGEFRETGFLDVLDPRTRKRMPNPAIQLDADAPAATLQVRYVDQNGVMQGPFPIRFDPMAALVRDQRKILDMTAGSWLSFRDFNGVLLYYTHLVSYRCAIREVKIGLDTTIPEKTIKLPPCNTKDPYVIPHDAQVYFKVPGNTRSVSVELTYQDGSVSEIKNFRR